MKVSENVDDLMTFIGNIIGRWQAHEITRIWLCVKMFEVFWYQDCLSYLIGVFSKQEVY